MLDCHVVAHTHWDREWYHPVERFRQRLVALVDELIDDPPRGDESFLLDGQTIVLDDYLAVRPDRASALSELLRNRRLEAGPWFVLADELIPSGEALVRNLLTGRRTLRRIGIDSPPVLYCPDSFGHPAALPSIAAGFGLPLIILWRGYGGARSPAGDVVRWASPSGDSALVYHLPRDGYEFGSHLPVDASEAAARWQRMREELRPRSTTGIELIPNGADHHARQLGQRDAVAAIAAAAQPDHVHSSSVRAFSEQLVKAAGERDSLPTIRGELRDSYGYTWTLQGSFATRAHEKRMNARAERLLLRDAEPWAALASRRGASKRVLVDAAWRTLLEAHPHDTLCGCSIDDVADAMELRIRSATNQAIGIRDDSLLQLIGHDPVEARTARDQWSPQLLIRNPAARKRGGLAFVEVEDWVADVAVGPGSGDGSSTANPLSRFAWNADQPLQLLSANGPRHGTHDGPHRLTESPRHYPDNDLVSLSRVAMWVDPVPGYGISPLALAQQADDRVTSTPRSLENAFCRVDISEDGVIAFEDKTTGRRVASLLELMMEDDAGDAYTPAPRPPTYDAELEGIDAIDEGVNANHRGPLIADLALHYQVVWRVDAMASPLNSTRLNRLSVLPVWKQRLRTAPVTTIELRLQLDAGARWLRVFVEGSNHLENHRIRLRFRSDAEQGDVWADAAFGPVSREPLVVPVEDTLAETPPKTAPLHRYVSRFNDTHGMTVFSDGLAEYEAEDDGSVVVTVLRAIGELSLPNLPERPGNAGWPKPIPGAQSIGPFGGAFAFMLHGSRTADTIDAIENAADDVLLPLEGTTLRSALRVPETVQGVELHGVGLAMSSVKESEDGDSLVLRCVNLTDTVVAGSWTVAFEIRACTRARIDETHIQELSPNGQSISFEAQPREIVTLLVR